MSCDKSIIQGDDETLFINAKRGDDPIDLTGASIIFNLIQEIGGSTILALTTGSGITITDADAGEFIITLTAAQTAALEGRYFYEVQITDSLSKKTTLRKSDRTLPFLYVLPDVVA